LKIIGILLAAGSATRFGSDKLLHALPQGVPIAVQAARHLKGELERVVAVVRPGATELQKLLSEEGVETVVCESAHEGMGASLACAVRAAGEAGGCLVALADMPFIRPETIRRVAERLEAGAAIVAPAWRGRRGHPVGFGPRFRSELERLGGDAGARELLDAQPASLELLDCDDPGVVRDVDTPADLEH
jgi:molybdenum cofactor cytidylyltransferase